MNDRFDCANILLDYAKSIGAPVKFRYEDGDLLSLAIANGSDAQVEFVLDKLTRKYGTVAETIRVLRSNNANLTECFLKLTDRLYSEDSFATEYARFEAPKALFGRNGKTSIGMSTDKHPESWTMDGSAAKKLWIQNSKYGEKLSDAAGQKITVVAKFHCFAFPDFWDMIDLKYAYDSVRLT